MPDNLTKVARSIEPKHHSMFVTRVVPDGDVEDWMGHEVHLLLSKRQLAQIVSFAADALLHNQGSGRVHRKYLLTLTGQVVDRDFCSEMNVSIVVPQDELYPSE